MTEATSTPAATAGAATENQSSNVESQVQTPAAQPPAQTDPAQGAAAAAAATTPPAFTPNFKYKAAMQEKEIDEFWRPLIKDADSEKKVKDLFSRVDAFDFMKQKRESVEKEYDSLLNDYNSQGSIVGRFNEAVKADDLSSAFRISGITKEQVFRWTQQQLAIMEMPAEQRAQYERAEAQAYQKSELDQKIARLEQGYQDQAVQARTFQLDMALSRPDVVKIAETWDKNQDEPGAFRQFVIDEARRIFYDTNKDVSPDEAIASVMKRFGKFFPTGDAVTPTAQTVVQAQANKPVIPNVTGKAASPIKKVPRTLDDLKKLAKEMA